MRPAVITFAKRQPRLDIGGGLPLVSGTGKATVAHMADTCLVGVPHESQCSCPIVLRSALVFDALGAGEWLRQSGSGDERLALSRSLLGAVDAMTCNLAWLCLRLLHDDEVLCCSRWWPAVLRIPCTGPDDGVSTDAERSSVRAPASPTVCLPTQLDCLPAGGMRP